MNSLFKKAIALTCAVLLAVSLTACNEKTETKQTVSDTKSVSTKSETAAVKETVEESKSNAKTADTNIVGSWEYKDGGFTYIFKDDGTGTYDVSGSLMKFTYEADGSTLSILYENSTEPMELEYELDGDKLNVKDSMGNDTIYNRK